MKKVVDPIHVERDAAEDNEVQSWCDEMQVMLFLLIIPWAHHL